MAVKTCEFCGSTFLASAEECPNCKKDVSVEDVMKTQQTQSLRLSLLCCYITLKI